MANLLDEASILLSATAYDNGSMLAVKPSENLYGAELVTNGDFATDSDWTKGSNWSISSGKAIADGSSQGALTQTLFTPIIGKKYLLSYEISDYLSGNIRVYYGGVFTNFATSNGIYSEIITATSTASLFQTSIGSNFTGSIDNISVKEDLSGDFQFSRNSAATRVNAQGLVENVQILSSDLVSNGDFSQEGVQEVSNGSFSQEGAEEVTNGDFATDTDWNKTQATISNGEVNISSDGSYAAIDQSNVSVIGKTYFYSIDVKSIIGTLQFRLGSGTDVDITTTGVKTGYIKATSTTLEIKRKSGAGVIDARIDNVSVKEVGQDWSLGTGWSIGDGRASCDGGSGNLIQSITGSTPNKTFLITFTLSNYITGSVTPSFVGAYDSSLIYDANGTYSAYINSVADNRLVFYSNLFNGSITNVSVKEVGQDWTLETGWSIGDDKAVANTTGNFVNLYQNSVFVVGKTYKTTFTIVGYTQGKVRLTENGYDVSGFKNAVGTYTTYFTATQTGLYMQGSESFIGSITNISVIEITDDTNLPRINYEGFSYQDSLGSEVSNDVNFDNPLNWSLTGQSTVSNGVAHILQDNTSNTGIVADTTIINKKYKITGVVSDYVSGSIGFASIGSTSPREAIPSKNGEFTIYYTSTRSTPSAWNIQRIASPCNLKIDNVSVKEYLGQEVVPNSGCGSWLMEPQSTNLITYSEDFSNASWTKTNLSITSNSIISPSGVLNSSKLIPNTTNAQHKIDITKTVTSGATVSLSAFVKKGEYNFCCLYEVTSGKGRFFDISNGTQGGSFGSFPTTSDIKNYGNDWYKISITTTVPSTSARYIIYVCDTISSTTMTGNGTSGVYVYGAMLEQNSFPTSYIPTQGATSTRSQDIANNSGNASLINSEEGVLYAEISGFENDNVNRYISLCDGSSLNSIRIFYYNDGGTVFFRKVVNNVSVIVSTSTTINQSELTKIAIRYNSTSFDIFSNGIKIITNSNSDTFANNTLSTINFTDSNGSSSPFHGKTKALAVFKTALTDASLRSLTYPQAVATTFDLNFNTIADDFTFTRGSEATFVNAQGLIQSTASNDAPRLDYSTGSKAFLLEPQSTNLIEYSKDFSNSYWSKGGQGNAVTTIVTDDYAISPDGTQNATRVQFDAVGSLDSDRANLVRNFSFTTGQTYSISCWVKSTNGTSQIIQFRVAGVQMPEEQIATSEWKLYTATFTATATVTDNFGIQIRGTNSVNESDILIFGFQLEQNSYATSYIPTSGASATRNQELCNNATPVINSEEGTLYAEISNVSKEDYSNIALTDGTNSQRVQIYFNKDALSLMFFVRVDGVLLATHTVSSSGINYEDTNKIAIKYKTNDMSFWLNGIKVGTSTSGTLIPNKFTQLGFNSGAGGAFFGNTKGLKYYPKALADVQLEDLTTI